MAENPSYRGTDVQMSGENPVNSPKPRTRSTSNKFNNSYPHITTARYGTVTPFYVANTVENEKHPLYSSHEVRAETMVSPRFGEIKMKKSYFDVPLRSIYPLNYDLMRVPPVEGEDINDLTFSNRAFIPGSFFFSLQNYLSNFADKNNSVSNYVSLIFILEKFFSRSSLFDYLGCHLSSVFSTRYQRFNVGNYDSFDLWFEKICDEYFNNNGTLTSGWYIKIVNRNTNKIYVPFSAESSARATSSYNFVSIHYILELLRDDFTNYEIYIENIDDDSQFNSVLDTDFFANMFSGVRISWNNSTNLNIERIISYQLVCAEYFTDDHIDDIYSTDKYRNMFRLYFDTIVSYSSSPFFEINGVSFPYDVFASVAWYSISSLFTANDFFSDDSAIKYILLLLTKRHSLRFEDYFVGGRLNPLAVGDVNTPVVDGNVNTYEVARSMVFTRFLNSVNLSGPEFDNYSKDILDNVAPPRQDVPKFLGMSMSNVGSYEVENTSSDHQGKLVTNIRSTDERFAFDVTLDHDSIILGLVTFESRRMYSKTVDRFFYHTDRYDDFNPMLQHTGDQSISLAELRAGSSFDDNFAYGVSDGEYKQRFGVVSGGVVDFLPSWVMVTDVVDSYDDEDNLNSSYIRSKDVEFDRFFSSLTNNSDAGYFHFVLYFNNQTEPIKPMIVAPEILL